MPAIDFPYNLLGDFPGWSTEFEIYKREELSRQAGGRTIAKDLGDPLWRATYVTRILSPNELDEWRAKIDVLDGPLQEFRGYPLSRWRPQAYPNATHPDGWGVSNGIGTLHTIGSEGLIRVSGVPTGYVAKVGDMIQIGGADLHRIVVGDTANGDGHLADVELRPRLWPGVTTGANVRFLSPSCVMTIEPGSISSPADPQTGRASISFRAFESR